MRRHRFASAMILPVLAIACTTAPVRPDRAGLQAAVARAGVGAPRLPRAGEDYLDPAWFGQALSAEGAVQAALRNNPRTRSELSRLDAAQAERVQAGLLRNPIGSLMALRPEGGGRFELDYGLTQSLFDLLTRSRRIAVADAAQRRVEAEVMLQLATLAQDSEAAYYEALIAAARLRLRRGQLALEQESLLLLQRQAIQGAVPASAVLEQQAATSRQAHELQAAESVLAQARAGLAQQLGLSTATRLVLPEALPELVLPGLDEPALQALAARYRPELRMAVAGIDQAGAERTLERGLLRVTDPSIGGFGTRERDGSSLNGPSVQISLPVFDTGQARRDAAQAKAAQAGFLVEAMRRQIPLEVERALAVLIASRTAAGHADHHLRQQRQLEQLARRSYEQGAIDLFRYRQSSRARLDADSERLESVSALWTAAIALQRATGVASVAAGRADGATDR